jgi:hypothetical protein
MESIAKTSVDGVCVWNSEMAWKIKFVFHLGWTSQNVMLCFFGLIMLMVYYSSENMDIKDLTESDSKHSLISDSVEKRVASIRKFENENEGNVSLEISAPSSNKQNRVDFEQLEI